MQPDESPIVGNAIDERRHTPSASEEDLRNKEEELYLSIQGFFSDRHRFIILHLLSTIDMLEKEIEALDFRIRDIMYDHEDLLYRMEEAAGIASVSSRDILAEIGPDLSLFPAAEALASWAGLCPGNNESAGKRKTAEVR